MPPISSTPDSNCPQPQHQTDTAHQRALTAVLALTAVYTVAEVVGGLLTGSLALLADAVHMLSDDLSLALALFAVWVARRPATPQRTFGYRRAEILAAFVNGTTLVAISLWIFIEAVRRMTNPPAVASAWMLAVAAVGLGVNVLAAWILGRHHHESLNMAAVFWHVMADLLGSLGTIAAAVIIMFTGWRIADPVVSLFIGLLVVISSWKILRDSVDILLESTPAGVNAVEIYAALTAHPGVADVRDLHVWTIASGFPALTAHVFLRRGEDMISRRSGLEKTLEARFGIRHTTLQMDYSCEDILDHQGAVRPATPRTRFRE
jgi:cobalt-zinc-cadmium efflux system protein